MAPSNNKNIEVSEVFEKYGVKFTRVNESHLEMLRNWRNSDFVRTKMLYQEHITPEMQERWFHTINNDRNFYYVAQVDGEYVGLIIIKNVENKAGEPGFFLSNEKYQDTSATTLVNFAFGEFTYEVLGIEKEYIHVRKDNAEAMKWNLACGFHIIEEQSGEDFYFLELDRKNSKPVAKIVKLKNYLLKKQL